MKLPEHKSPKFSQRFLGWFCKPELLEEIIGDLCEYEEELTAQPLWKRRVLYWFHVLNFLQPWALKRSERNYLIQFTMLRHHIKIAFRNFSRQKVYSLINISGLVAGTTVVMLIGLWIHDEMSFDTHSENHERVFRVLKTETGSADRSTGDNQPFALAELLRTSYSNYFEHVAMELTWTGEHTLASEKKKFLEEGRFIGTALPEILDLEMKHGSRKGFGVPNAIMISASLADKLFGYDDPIGKILTFDAQTRLNVAGVYEDLPQNSYFHEIQYFLPFHLFYQLHPWAKPDSWRGNNVNVYVRTRVGVQKESAQQAISEAMLSHVDQEIATSRNPALSLHAMADWHFYSNFDDPPGTVSATLRFVWFYGVIGGFVLLLACINFVNLSTARFERRAKEVGIRKAIGSRRKQLMAQFLSESMIIVAVAYVLSLGLVSLLLPWFNDVSGKALTLLLSDPVFWVLGVGFIMTISLLAGSYPAFYLSSFQPVRALKGGLKSDPRGLTSRRLLVVFQFTVSIALAIGSLIVHDQIQFGKNRLIGYSQEDLLVVKMTTDDYQAKYDVLRTELLNSGVVTRVAGAGVPITENQYNNKGFDWIGKQPGFDPIFNDFYVSPELGKTIDWEILNGRDFSEKISSDQRGVIINESAATLFGFDNPVGQVITWKSRNDEAYQILGVVKDMVRYSPFEAAPPSLFFLSEELPWLHLRMSPQASLSDALTRLESVFNEFLPNESFEYQFVDDAYATKFQAEERVGQLSGFFTVLAVLISCLGLFGLASFVAEQRTKEIGIRKVLGATLANLWKMLSKDFVLLVGWASLIAAPLAWYFLDGWLADYQYRISLQCWTFGLAVLGALFVTLLTVSYQAIKVSVLNPVKALRSE